MRSPRPGLGDLERAVMDHLWDRRDTGPTPPDDPDRAGGPPEAGPAGVTVREVHAALADRGLAYTTVLTVLDRLAKKGLVRRTRDGRAWRYLPGSSREELTARAMWTPLADLDAPDRRAAMLHFVDDATPEDLEDLRAALARLEEDPPGTGSGR